MSGAAAKILFVRGSVSAPRCIRDLGSSITYLAQTIRLRGIVSRSDSSGRREVGSSSHWSALRLIWRSVGMGIMDEWVDGRGMNRMQEV